MPTDVRMLLEFVTPSGTVAFTESITDDLNATDKGKENLARELFAELRKAVSLRDTKDPLPDLRDLLLVESPNTKRVIQAGPMAFIDLFNRPAIWLEISNTFVDLRFLLPQAKAYKDLEPKESSPVSDPFCAYLHYQKMYMLNLAVFQLVKIQDLVLRLLQESFGGELIPVDYDDEDWEKKLTLKDAKKGLNNLLKNGKLAAQEHQLILDALEIPSQSPHKDTVIRYRNGLAHRIRPSVDYPELFTAIQDRAGQPIIDPSTGKEKGRTYSIGGGKSKAEFIFADLYAALSDYMGYIADMLKAVKGIPRLA
jgi:hypothetical protein